MAGLCAAPRRGSASVLAVLLAALLSQVGPADGQTFSFDEVPVPEAYSLQTHYMWYVYALKDAPDVNLGEAVVNFDVVVRPKNKDKEAPSAKEVEEYASLQITVMPQKEFWNVVDPGRFCEERPGGGVLALKKAGVSGVFTHTVSGNRAEPYKAMLTETGVYVLVITNCGKMVHLEVQGSVTIQNPWGYLPAIEYYKMPLYGGFAIFYIVTSSVWLLLALRWWKQLFYVQKCIAMLNLMGVVECIAWWLLYSKWNSSSEYSTVLFLVAALASVWKVMVSFRTILVSALSAEPSKADDDDEGVGFTVHAALMVWMIAEFNLKTVLSYRHSRQLKMSFVLMNAVPAVVMAIVLFAWVHHVLIDMLKELQERKNDTVASLFSRSQAVAVLATVGAIVVALLQIFDPTVGESPEQWNYHFIASDGLFQGVFAVVLCAAMLIWLPSESTQGYEYAPQSQVGGETIGAPAGVIWEDDDVDEEGDTKGNKVAVEDKPAE